MADSASFGKVTSNNETSSPNNSPHLAFTTISNIKLHIHVQLSLSEPNYKKWSRFFRLLILCFNLKGFIDGTTIASSADNAEWYQFDALIQGWILTTITDEVFDLVLANNLSAHALWKAIYNLFHNNKHARAMQLEHRFRTTVKGHLSINEYCRLLKNLSEYLDDVDAPVTEHALVLQDLQGLPHDIRSQPSLAPEVAADMGAAHIGRIGAAATAADLGAAAALAADLAATMAVAAGPHAAAVAVAAAVGAAVEVVAVADISGNHLA
ncbi:unnamed protein product [Cuscuta campestris]|uniref:Retrotransposon Copia-like N-terminal domain-containing protein n=1 Tax=Cuscuta campestris TaxID=132261 RepID=A0A484KM65_9ASTE|nr:unnamed protein product [Cuscuta campestris]